MADGGVGMLAALVRRIWPARPRISSALMLLDPISRLRYGSSRRIGLKSDSDPVNNFRIREAQSVPTSIEHPHHPDRQRRGELVRMRQVLAVFWVSMILQFCNVNQTTPGNQDTFRATNLGDQRPT